MRHRKRAGREPSDRELRAAAIRVAARHAAGGNMAAARAALREVAGIESRAALAKAAHEDRPVHPMRARQLVAARNRRARTLGLDRILGLKPLPPHPTKREERTFAKCAAPKK